MKERPKRPDFWPTCSHDGEPWALLVLLHGIVTERQWQRLENRPPHTPDVCQRRIDLYVRCLSHACRTWRSPSTPYEEALYNLCLAAIGEANTHAARAAAKEEQ